VVRQFRDRQALLWVCQRYDLLSGEEPHTLDLPPNEAALRYRDQPEKQDFEIASHYWEAVWLEGARSPLLSTLRSAADGGPSRSRRATVVLAGPADSRTEVSSSEFLPISVLPGRLDQSAPPDSRYGVLRARARERIAWDLAMRLANFRGRALIVVGAQQEADLRFLYEVLEDCPIPELTLVLVWPAHEPPPPPPKRSGIFYAVWKGSSDQFSKALSEIGAPSARELPKWAVRAGKYTIELAAADLHRISGRFALLKEVDLIPPSEFGVQDLLSFLEGSLENWSAYGVGLPVKRSYSSEKNLTLFQELGAILDLYQKKESEELTHTLLLPCEGGAGATTMLRSAAYQAASEGFPTLVLRPEQVELNLEDIRAFMAVLSEKCQSVGMEVAPPTIVVLDVEHASIRSSRSLSQFLAGHRHRAIILQAKLLDEKEDQHEIRNRKFTRLRPLLSEATEREIVDCETTFRNIVQRWQLPFEVPSIERWRTYESATRWRTPIDDSSTSMFWVALRFFLTNDVDLTTKEKVASALGTWIEKRTTKVTDERMRQLLLYVAVLSSLRIPCPIWTALRPVTGGTFSSILVDLFKQLEDLLVWGAASEELDDQVLRFAHPALADEFLRQQAIHNLPEKIRAIRPVLLSLSAGHQGDIWVAESLAADVIAPHFEERRVIEWTWRLEVFDLVPPVLRDQSKTILHHWARCLYQSAEPSAQPPISIPERRQRIELAIDKLRLAIGLPRRKGRDEHPSHLYNTLGVALSKYAKLLEDLGTLREESIKAWNEACHAFEQSIRLSPGVNLDALLAFSARLLSHADDNRAAGSQLSEERLADVSYALSLLDTAEEVQQDYVTDNPELERTLATYKARALNLLRDGAGIEYLRELQNTKKSDLGYYCEARLALSHANTAKGLEDALGILKEAERRGVKPEPRSLALRLTLLRRHPGTQFDFALLLSLYKALESHGSFQATPVDLFRHAVLCYQTGNYSEGADRFRKLRELLRNTGNTPPRVTDFWRAKDDPNAPQLTQLKVIRIVNERRGQGYVEDLSQDVPFRPLHFGPAVRENSVISCAIRFEPWGPFAIPTRDVEKARPRRM